MHDDDGATAAGWPQSAELQPFIILAGRSAPDPLPSFAVAASQGQVSEPSGRTSYPVAAPWSALAPLMVAELETGVAQLGNIEAAYHLKDSIKMHIAGGRGQSSHSPAEIALVAE